MQKIQAVIFDMDGTIFDSEPVYMSVLQDAAARLGGYISDELYLSTVGTTMAESYDILAAGLDKDFPMIDFKDLWPKLWEEYTKTNGVVLKDGLLDLLKHLNKNGCPKALATSSFQTEANLCLSMTGLRNEFESIVTGDLVTNGKPNPEIYLKVAKNIGIEPQYCLAIEDSNAGARAAISAGMQTVIIPDLIPTSDDIKADVLAELNSLSEVISLLENLNS